MAKIVITIEDTKDDCIAFKADFDPPIETTQRPTEAQILASRMIEAVSEIVTGWNEVEREIEQ